MTSHWPTFADGLFWCACDNRTFATQDEWQLHVVTTEATSLIEDAREYLDWADPMPPDGVKWAVKLSRALEAIQSTHEAVEQPRRG